MTKKEKKAEALRLKAEIEARHPKPEPTAAEKEASHKKYDEKKYRRRKGSSAEAIFNATGKYPVSKHFDLGKDDRW